MAPPHLGPHHHPWRRLRGMHEWTLRWAHLPVGVLGLTDFSARTITLAVGLTQAERRCTIAHELEHAERGPVPAWLEAREERAVDAVMARRLIDLERLADAMLWSDDEHEIAEDLWVDVDTLRVRMVGLTDVESAELNRRLDEAERWLA